MHHQRYIAQRDPDSTWSVRELESNCPAIILNQLMVGMTEMDAVLTVRKFSALDHIEAFAGTSQAPSQAGATGLAGAELRRRRYSII